MKSCMLFNVLAFLALATVTGCSSSGGASTDSGGPVATTPLKGTIAGKDFIGKIAIAQPGFADEGSKKEISIYDTDVDCSGAQAGGDHHILTSIEWTAGIAKNLKLDFSGGDNQTVTFVTGPGENVISNQGRIEVIEAPTDVNAKGKLRLRATAESNHVEGEIAVLVCDR